MNVWKKANRCVRDWLRGSRWNCGKEGEMLGVCEAFALDRFRADMWSSDVGLQ